MGLDVERLLLSVFVSSEVPYLDQTVDGAYSQIFGVGRECACAQGVDLFLIVGIEGVLDEFVLWFF